MAESPKPGVPRSVADPNLDIQKVLVPGINLHNIYFWGLSDGAKAAPHVCLLQRDSPSFNAISGIFFLSFFVCFYFSIFESSQGKFLLDHLKIGRSATYMLKACEPTYLI
jgi:hypothetical protein